VCKWLVLLVEVGDLQGVLSGASVRTRTGNQLIKRVVGLLRGSLSVWWLGWLFGVGSGLVAGVFILALAGGGWWVR
jgi:hypothetical protein